MGLMAHLSSFLPKRNDGSRKLIVGLGNPGKEYQMTRHNVGFLVLNALADGATWSMKKTFKGEMAEVIINGQKTLLFKPATFMNLSGQAVQAAMQFYKIPLGNVLVAHDDADLPFGEVRVQTGRGSAGHNGVKSVMECLGSADFVRVRVGIGRAANGNIPLDEFVLGRWSDEEKNKLDDIMTGVVSSIKNRFV